MIIKKKTLRCVITKNNKPRINENKKAFHFHYCHRTDGTGREETNRITFPLSRKLVSEVRKKEQSSVKFSFIYRVLTHNNNVVS